MHAVLLTQYLAKSKTKNVTDDDDDDYSQKGSEHLGTS